MPEAEVKLLEDGYESAVQRTGHGLQRAFILTMLQHLIAARKLKGNRRRLQFGRRNPRSRRASSAELDSGHRGNQTLSASEPPAAHGFSSAPARPGLIPGVAKKTQVIYSTHAPLFIGLDRFDQIRLLRKEGDEAGKPKVTAIAKAALDAVADDLWKLDGQRGYKYTADTLRPACKQS